MADMVAKLYELLGGDPPPGHEIAAWVTVDLSGPDDAGWAKGGGLLGNALNAVETNMYGDMPAKAKPGADTRAVRSAQKEIGLPTTMLWAVNSHNLLIFRTTSVAVRRPTKLTARVALAEVSFEAQVTRRLAVRLRGVPVEVKARKQADLEQFTEALRSILPADPPA